MKPISPCRSCHATDFAFVPSSAWGASWGPMPRGCHGAVFCGRCGAWNKWAEPGTDKADHVKTYTSTTCPRVIDANQRDRASAMQACEDRSKKQGNLL